MPKTNEARLKPLKLEASRIFKLCLEKDQGGLIQGLELAKAALFFANLEAGTTSLLSIICLRVFMLLFFLQI